MGANLRYEVAVANRILSVMTPPRCVFAAGEAVVLRFPFDNTVAVPREAKS